MQPRTVAFDLASSRMDLFSDHRGVHNKFGARRNALALRFNKRPPVEFVHSAEAVPRKRADLAARVEAWGNRA